MFVGHSAVALALVGLGAYSLGWSRERALLVGVFAAAVAALPDVDMLYALTGVMGIGAFDAVALANGFWEASTVVHRSLTHSIVLAIPGGVLIGLLAAGGRARNLGWVTAAGLLVVTAAGTSPTLWVVPVAFLLGVVGLGFLARRLDLNPRAAGLAAAVALLSHPFGDLFTGEPPWLLYPLDIQLLTDRIALSADPTLHLLGAFFVELAAIWLGVLAVTFLRDTSVRAHLRPRAVLGGGYALAVLVLPAPTLSASYQFVFSVTAVGFLGAIPHPSPSSWTTRVITGLAAVTVAGLAYAGAYIAL